MSWPEGRLETFALMALIFISIVAGTSLAGTAVFAYRSSIGLRSILSRWQILRQIIQATLWVEYIAWASNGFKDNGLGETALRGTGSASTILVESIQLLLPRHERFYSNQQRIDQREQS